MQFDVLAHAGQSAAAAEPDLVGQLAATVVVIRIAGRLYAGTLLAGNKMTWREAWKAEPVR